MRRRLAGLWAILLWLAASSAEAHRHVSLAFGVKVQTWTDLNEEDDQQGSVGKERYRLVATLSILF